MKLIHPFSWRILSNVSNVNKSYNGANRARKCFQDHVTTSAERNNRCFSSYHDKRHQYPSYSANLKESMFFMRPFTVKLTESNLPSTMLVELIPKDPLSKTTLWDEKLNISLTVHDMGVFLDIPKTGFELKRSAKTLNLLPLDDGSVRLTLTQNKDEEDFTITHVLTPGQMGIVKLLFQQSIPILLGWGPYLSGNESKNESFGNKNKKDYGEVIFSPKTNNPNFF